MEARAAFARELLEVGGMQIVDADDAGATPRVALVAAPDALFETEVCARTLDLQARGVAVWIAGRPGPHEAALRAAGARGFVHVGADVVDALTAMRALAGSSS